MRTNCHHRSSSIPAVLKELENFRGTVTCRGERVIYTTPLKALSNQKLHEMRAQFGYDRVGLQTGDGSLNSEGDVVIMTTEVLRNILFRNAADDYSAPFDLSTPVGRFKLACCTWVELLDFCQIPPGLPRKGSADEPDLCFVGTFVGIGLYAGGCLNPATLTGTETPAQLCVASASCISGLLRADGGQRNAHKHAQKVGN